MKKNIALVAGGYSGEHVISLGTAATIAAHVDAERYAVYTAVVTREGWRHTTPDGGVVEIDRTDFSLPLPEGRVKFDAVFMAVHGTPGEDGKLQGYFDMLGIPYTGCNPLVSALTFNKGLTNAVVRALELAQVAPSILVTRGDAVNAKDAAQTLRLPVFVKPCESGSSLGVSKVKDWTTLETALDMAFSEDSQAMIEQGIDGREVSIGVYRAGGVVTTLPPTEIQTDREFFDYEAKYVAGQSREITPAPLADSVLQNLQAQAARLYAGLGCRGVVRMDFLLERDTDALYFLEVNTMPGQSEASIIPQQVRAAGGSLRDFYGVLLEEALAGAATPL